MKLHKPLHGEMLWCEGCCDVRDAAVRVLLCSLGGCLGGQHQAGCNTGHRLALWQRQVPSEHAGAGFCPSHTVAVLPVSWANGLAPKPQLNGAIRLVLLSL